MRCFHAVKPNKLHANKLVLTLCSVMVLMFSASCNRKTSMPANNSESSVPAEKETIIIQITAPSSIEQTIAPGRHFKAAGTLAGEIPDDAVLKVTLLDEAGHELRYAAADHKGTDHVIPSVIGGDITVFDPNTEFSEVTYTAPELVVTDPEDP